MEGKIIVGIVSAFLLLITASFLSSENLSKSQKVILFCLIIFPPAQWILGIFFLDVNKKSTNENISKKKEPEIYEKEIKSTILEDNKKMNYNIIATNEDKFNTKRELLQKSLEMNLITQIEFESKIKNLENEKDKIEKKIKESEVFKNNKIMLEKLYENEIITKEELTLKLENIENESNKNRYNKKEINNFGKPFRIEDFKELENDILIISSLLNKTKRDNGADIIIGFTRDHTIKTNWITVNPTLTDLVIKKKIPVSLIENIFKESINFPKFRNEFERYLRTKLE